MPLLPPPPTPNTGEFGPASNIPAAGVAGPITPVQAAPPDTGAMRDAQDVMTLVSTLRGLAERHPQAVPTVQQINDLIQQLQMSIVQSSPAVEPPAPPV